MTNILFNNKLKKKIYKFVSVTIIAVAMVVGFQMSKANNSASSLTMDNVKALAMADDEVSTGCWCAFVNWDICCVYHDSETSTTTQYGIRQY